MLEVRWVRWYFGNATTNPISTERSIGEASKRPTIPAGVGLGSKTLSYAAYTMKPRFGWILCAKTVPKSPSFESNGPNGRYL